MDGPDFLQGAPASVGHTGAHTYCKTICIKIDTDVLTIMVPAQFSHFLLLNSTPAVPLPGRRPPPHHSPFGVGSVLKCILVKHGLGVSCQAWKHLLHFGVRLRVKMGQSHVQVEQLRSHRAVQ